MFQGRARAVVVVLLVAGLVAGCATETPGTTQPPTGAVGADCVSPPNLVPGAALFGCNLVGALLAGMNLSGADFTGANLTGADLTGANLSNADFEGANLTGANLTGADLTGAILSGAILIGALFINALLGGAIFDFGRAFGATGEGGSGTPVGGSGTPGGSTPCTGALCPGYNEATVENPDAMLCRADMFDLTDGQIYIHRSTEDLVAEGLRSVVTDSATSFAGAIFDFSGVGFPLANMRALSVGHADYSGATLIHPVIACQDAEGARFAGATIHGTGVKDALTVIYDVRFLNSNFSNSTMWLTGLGHVDFTGSDAQNADWTAIEVMRAGNFPYLSQLGIDFTNVDFRNAALGVSTNPDTGSSGMMMSVKFGTDGTLDDWKLNVTFAGADLRDAHIRNLTSPRGIFTGAQTAGLTVDGDGMVQAATFDSGWLGVNWTGTYDFDGATCPDGSIGGSSNACF